MSVTAPQRIESLAQPPKSKKQIRREQFREKTAGHEAKIALQAMGHLQAGEPLLRYCINCKASFRMDPDELRFYFARELFLPRRCKPCRRPAPKAVTQ